jgi:hypothetical protein
MRDLSGLIVIEWWTHAALYQYRSMFKIDRVRRVMIGGWSREIVPPNIFI